MSSEKNPEVVGCDASIMKNVWEIRLREYQQKLVQEQERLEKSALPSINKDWQNRMTAKTGGHKRVERKVKPADTQTDGNIWKSKEPRIPPSLPQSKGPLGRAGIKAKPTASGSNDKTRPAKSFSRLQLLMFLTQTQPSSLVWGKSWKYKSSPSSAEGSTASSDWGQSWMFATHQPPSEEGGPCPNQEDPLSLGLWRKPDCRTEESQELDWSLPAEEWQTSWKRAERNQEDASVDGNDAAKLVESQHQYDSLYSSEWIDSWLSTKPVNQQDHRAAASEALEKGPVEQGQLRGASSGWEECWRLTNHHGNPSSRSSHHPEWDHSWRTATMVNPSQDQEHQSHGHVSEDQNQQGESLFNSIKRAPGSHLQLCSELLPDWTDSWQIPKNSSDPCEEIEKVLKAPPPEADAASEPQREKSPEVHDSADPRYLKHDVIYPTKTEFPLTKPPLLEMHQNEFPSSEWRESFKLIKHRRDLERRNLRLDSPKPLVQSGEHMKFTSSEWKHSWRFTPQSLNQSPEPWQQGWTTSTQIRLNWERHQENVSLSKFPKNGPTTERIWGESWRFSRHQYRSEPGQDKEQVRNGKPNSSHHPDNFWRRRNLARSVSDWQDAWMVSESPLHHDKPPFAQWREAWMWSIYHTLTWTEQGPADRWVDESVEIRQRAETGMRSLFETQMFGEEWSSSWRAGPVLNSLPSCYGSSGIPEDRRSSSDAEHPPSAGERGRSFRLANPMPHLEQPWLETHPNPGHYSELWSRTTKTQQDIKHNSTTSTFWTNSHQFLQNAQRKNDRKSKKPHDPRVISPEKIRTRKHLLVMEKDKPLERRWVGCHLLGKTQPCSKRSRGSGNQKLEDNTSEKLCEEWLESWRFSVQPESVKKKFVFKLLSGWKESWKFLLPRY